MNNLDKKYTDLLGDAYKNYCNDKKYTDLIGDAYKNYCNTYPDVEKTFQYEGSNIEVRKMTQEEFIEQIKTDNEFANEWGVTVEVRELSLYERFELFKNQNNGSHPEDIEMMDDYNIPTKLITITYNNETIEIYE